MISVQIKRDSNIHDRYLICGIKARAIGSSIKDLENKDTLVREISEIASPLTNLFSFRWGEGEDYKLRSNASKSIERKESKPF
jgi:hypothetical protein